MLRIVVTKIIKQHVRDRPKLFLIILTPIIFFLFFGFVFGSSDEIVTLNIGVIDSDTGFESDFVNILPQSYEISSSDSLGVSFLNILENKTELILEKSNIQIDISFYTSEVIMDRDIQSQSLELGIIIPENFTRIMLGIYNSQYNLTNGEFLDNFPISGGKTSLIFKGDPTVSSYQSAVSVMSDAFETFTDDIYGQDVFASVDLTGGLYTYSFESTEDEISEFHWLVSGFIVFIILLNMINVASIMAEERENKTIERMKMSLLPNSTIFTGIIIAQLIIGTVQIIISAIIIELNGVDLGFLQWLRVFVVLQILNINITGIGLVMASFTKSKKDATNVSGFLAGPLGFLSGSFLPVPDVWVIKALNIQIWDIIPSYHAVQAMQNIIILNEPLSQMLRPLGLLIIFSIIWFALGLVLYQKRVIESDS